MKDSITKNKIVKKAAQGAAVTGLWLLIWQAAAMAVGQELLLVSPLTMLRRLVQLVRQPVFWQAVFSSCGRIMSGVVLALAVGMILAALMSRFSFLYAFFRPALQVIKATPVASFIILALVWIKSYALGAFAAFLMVLPMVWANLYEGIAAVVSVSAKPSALFCGGLRHRHRHWMESGYCGRGAWIAKKLHWKSAL